ncbi:hypothetical protein B0H12DRAFT_1067230 [Mycena haematopus]|nr:hypothetical protein B0H12DRAFT_1067230 [Mycena haematopus]
MSLPFEPPHLRHCSFPTDSSMESTNSTARPLRRLFSLPGLRKRHDSDASDATIQGIPPLPSRRLETSQGTQFPKNPADGSDGLHRSSLDSTHSCSSGPDGLEALRSDFGSLTPELEKELGYRKMFTLPAPFRSLESNVAVMIR